MQRTITTFMFLLTIFVTPLVAGAREKHGDLESRHTRPSIQSRYGPMMQPPQYERHRAGDIVTFPSGTAEDQGWWDGFGLPVANGDVLCVLEYGDGIAIGGTFTVVGDVPANHVALWDGMQWKALGSGTSGDVTSLCVFQGDLIVGGRFIKAGGADALGLARWDGAQWSAVPGFEGVAHALTVYQGELVVGGAFRPSALMPSRYMARWDGVGWGDFSGDVNGQVRALLVHREHLFVGGSFDSAGGVGVSGVAVWDAGWSGLGSGIRNGNVRGTVEAMVGWGDSLLVGGTFDHAGELPARNVAVWNGSAWNTLGSGTSGHLRTLAVHEGTPYAGGSMETGGLMRWNGSYWDTADPWTTWFVASLVNQGEDLIAGGLFGAYNYSGPGAFNVGRLSGGRWYPFENWTGRMRGLLAGYGGNGQITAITAHQDKLVAAGYFTYAGTGSDWSEIRDLAVFDGASWEQLTIPGGGGVAYSLLSDGDSLFVGGSFWDVAGAVPVYRFDGTSWTALDTLSEYIWSLARFEGGLYAGSSNFWEAPSTPTGVYHWTGSHWELVGPLGRSDYSGISCMVVHDGQLVVGGVFQQVGGVAASNVAMWNGSTWSPLGAGLPDGWDYYIPVTSLESHNGTLVAGRVDGVWYWDGSLWKRFGEEPIHNVWSLASVAGELYAGGQLWWVDDPPRQDGVARWDGQRWRGLGSGTNGPVASFARLGSSLYVGGPIGMAGGKGSFGVARWDGLPDWTPTQEVPARPSLARAHPNPFRLSTELTYDVPREGRVRISVFDLSGRKVTTLMDGVVTPGSYRRMWDGRRAGGSELPAGVYFVRMEQPGGTVQTRKIVRLR